MRFLNHFTVCVDRTVKLRGFLTVRVPRPSSRLSFDDLIELRFLPSRRRRRDPEYFEELESMIMPREVNHRVSREDRRAALLALTRSGVL